MIKKSTAIAIFLLAVFPANSQNPSEFNKVSSADVLDQLEAAMLMNELRDRSPQHTVTLVKKIIALNKMQLQDAEKREYDKKNPGKKSPLEGLVNTERSFYELRNSICKDFSGILVDLDGQVKPGCDQSAK